MSPQHIVTKTQWNISMLSIVTVLKYYSFSTSIMGKNKEISFHKMLSISNLKVRDDDELFE